MSWNIWPISCGGEQAIHLPPLDSSRSNSNYLHLTSGYLAHKDDKTIAALYAGYSTKTAKVQGYRLFTKIHQYIEALAKDLLRGSALTAEQVVPSLSLIASSEICDYMTWAERLGVCLVDANKLTSQQAYGVEEVIQTVSKNGPDSRTGQTL